LGIPPAAPTRPGAMSFRDLDGPKGHAPKHQPKQKHFDENTSFERDIRTHVQEMQEVVRKAASQLELAQRSRLSRRAATALDELVERGERLSEDTARLFRDWTVHLAGEPSERHRKKFSFEKLQKAFDEEAAQFKDVARRAANARQEALAAEARQAAEAGPGQACAGGTGAAPEGWAASSEQEPPMDCDVEVGLLDDSAQCQEGHLRVRTAIAQEREEGIRRIQCQVSEVSTMLMDLASIVQDQGVHLDTLESSAQASSDNTKQAALELRKASDRQRGNRERMCCLLVVAVAVLVFVILPQVGALHPRMSPAQALPPRPGGGAGGGAASPGGR